MIYLTLAGVASVMPVSYAIVVLLARHVPLGWDHRRPRMPAAAVLTVPVRPHGAVAESQRAALVAARVIPGETERGSIER